MPRNTIPQFTRGADPSTFVDRVIRIPTQFVKRLPGQPRTFFDPREMLRLRESIAEIGQQQPATVIPWTDGTFRLRDGERRLRSCVELSVPLLALVAEARSLEEEFELSAAANMNRASHSPLEKALAMKRLRDGPLKRNVAEIARTFGVTGTTVASHLIVLDQLPAEIVDLMDPAKQGDRRRTLQISAAVRLTALREYPKKQLQIANQIVRFGLTIDTASRMIDDFAEKKQISSGRGRERKPSDHIALMQTVLRRLSTQLEFFAERSEEEIEQLFAYMPRSRHEEVASQLARATGTLSAVSAKVARARNVGARRTAA